MFNSPTVVFDAVFRIGYPDAVGVHFPVVGDVGVGVDVVLKTKFSPENTFSWINRSIEMNK